MYGTVAMMKLKPGMREEFGRCMEDIARSVEYASGFVASYIYYPDTDGDLAILVVAFDSAESYRRNADLPQTHEGYLKWREFLREDPVWYDGEAFPFLRFR